ncbi:trypsin-like serine protease [Streptomyces sp. NPDC049555]|uniref:trypsin-like serine protease n=1 Tax=Streptomyces sp. NPDC049555 TaxID=3154930 RepID=UPI0034200E12
MVGDEAKDGQYPFTAKLYIGDGARACSGALVDPRWVLTAASCFAETQGSKITAGAPKMKVKVAVGTADLSERDPVMAAELVPHENRDLVMVRLVRSLADKFGSALNPPIKNSQPISISATPPTQGDTLKVSGFGRTSDEWAPERMHAAGFSIDSVQGGSFTLKGKDQAASICPGDAGSPAFREKDGRYELVGINVSSSQTGCFGSATNGDSKATEVRVDDINSWVQRVRMASMYRSATDLVASADFNGDGRSDIAGVLDDGKLYAFYTAADGKLEYGRTLWRQPDPNLILAQKIIGGDFNGDGKADVAALTKDGHLLLYPGTAEESLGTPIDMWKDASWGGMAHIARFKADNSGRDGVIAVAKDGSLYAYRSAPDGKLLDSRREMWRDKTWFKKQITTGDFNGDGRDDIAAVANDGALHLYRGNAKDMFDDGTYMWRDNTWDAFQTIVGGDFNRDGKSDVAALRGAPRPEGPHIPTTDGRAVDLFLYPGQSDGTLGERSLMWPINA